MSPPFTAPLAPEESRESNRPVSPRNKALDLLARREHSVVELRDKLLVRDFDADAVEAAISRLLEEGLLSDARFADAFMSSRLRKGHGPVRIRAELVKRGVADSLIEPCVDAADVDWIELAKQVRDKKFGGQRTTGYREWSRQAKFLQYRGFTTEQVRHVLGDMNDSSQ